MNAAWMLIMFIHFSGDNLSSKLSMEDFTSKEACVKAGNETKRLTYGKVKEVKFTCVKK